MGGRIERRRSRILDILSQIPITTTQHLASETGVSNETIRKDLDALADEGLILKVHGGVALANSAVSSTPFDLRAQHNVKEKRQIANAALEYIEENDSIILEGSTTSLELARALLQQAELLQSLVVITNSFSIASLFEGGEKCKRLFFLGGWSNPAEHATRGLHTTKMLSDLYANKAFISGAALGNDMNLTCYLDEDMAFQRQAIASAKETILMIDSEKIRKTAVFTVCPMEDIDYLITDQRVKADIVAALKEHSVNVKLAKE